MGTSAECRQQLEMHLQKFREVADERMREKVIGRSSDFHVLFQMAKWACYIPAMVSATILICQLLNTVIFGSFAYNFGQLYILLEAYMRETDAMNLTIPNSTNPGQIYRFNGTNAQRINEIDLYHDQLWTMFVAEVIELIFPMINLFMFAWIIQDKTRHHLPTKVQIIYLLAPALALVLSIAQACMIYVTLSDSLYTIRFLLSKLLGVLLEINKSGRLPIEAFFECEFYNDDDIVKPPCAGTIHDQVVSRTTVHLVMTIHLIPVVFCLYIFLNNLKSNRTDHLFLYIESVDPQVLSQRNGLDLIHRRTLKDTVKELVKGWNARFVPKKIFDWEMGIYPQPKAKDSRPETSF
ncbi:hypothetical protein M3Y98_00889000 [Aphelenchoides besseyi]|nr:hypothetical protein M3Y98_00889000 [Aphelenchoides besseyi]KAI6192974.1 hypothetical protein M3Y96_00969100 [Aphelenchoides besseyi]